MFCEYDDNNGLKEVVDPELLENIMIKCNSILSNK